MSEKFSCHCKRTPCVCTHHPDIVKAKVSELLKHAKGIYIDLHGNGCCGSQKVCGQCKESVKKIARKTHSQIRKKRKQKDAPLNYRGFRNQRENRNKNIGDQRDLPNGGPNPPSDAAAAAAAAAAVAPPIGTTINNIVHAVDPAVLREELHDLYEELMADRAARGVAPAVAPNNDAAEGKDGEDVENVDRVVDPELNADVEADGEDNMLNRDAPPIFREPQQQEPIPPIRIILEVNVNNPQQPQVVQVPQQPQAPPANIAPGEPVDEIPQIPVIPPRAGVVGVPPPLPPNGRPVVVNGAPPAVPPPQPPPPVVNADYDAFAARLAALREPFVRNVPQPQPAPPAPEEPIDLEPAEVPDIIGVYEATVQQLAQALREITEEINRNRGAMDTMNQAIQLNHRESNQHRIDRLAMEEVIRQRLEALGADQRTMYQLFEQTLREKTALELNERRLARMNQTLQNSVGSNTDAVVPIVTRDQMVGTNPIVAHDQMVGPDDELIVPLPPIVANVPGLAGAEPSDVDALEVRQRNTIAQLEAIHNRFLQGETLEEKRNRFLRQHLREAFTSWKNHEQRKADATPNAARHIVPYQRGQGILGTRLASDFEEPAPKLPFKRPIRGYIPPHEAGKKRRTPFDEPALAIPTLFSPGRKPKPSSKSGRSTDRMLFPIANRLPEAPPVARSPAPLDAAQVVIAHRGQLIDQLFHPHEPLRLDDFNEPANGDMPVNNLDAVPINVPLRFVNPQLFRAHGRRTDIHLTLVARILGDQIESDMWDAQYPDGPTVEEASYDTIVEFLTNLDGWMN